MVTATRNKISPWKDLCKLFICQPIHIWFAGKRIFFHLKGFKIREVEWLSLRTMGLFRTQWNIDDGPLCEINWLPTKLTAFAKKLHYGCSTGSYIGLWKQLNIYNALNWLFLWQCILIIFIIQTLTDYIWALHKNKNCTFPLSLQLY